MKRIAILASGTGSNAEQIMHYVAQRDDVEVALVLSNKTNAAVLQKAKDLGVVAVAFTRDELYNTGHVLRLLSEYRIDVVVLAGFLLLVPDSLVQAYSDRIINIHPALLPRHGGKGMYGMHVHRAVKAAGDDQTGITIHLVNAEYDKGRVLFQASCPILPQNTAEDIAAKVLQLEHAYFPQVVVDFAVGS